MNDRELLEAIEEAVRTGAKSLDLSGQELTTLPPEIGLLTNLTSLDLGINQLTALPPEIWQLTNLTTLDLFGNQLTALPPEIGRLTNLTTLNLAAIQLSALPPEIGRLTNLTSLDLSGNGLTALPPEIWQLTNLTTLGLGGTVLTTLPAEIGQLKGLTRLDLWSNRFTALPPEFWQLTNLTTLDLSGNGLTALPPEIGRLTNLTSLDLFGNQLTALPPEIWQLTNLTTLDLFGNQLTALPPEIGRLTNLTTLGLAGNLLTALPPEIGQLTNLTTLYLIRNQLTALPTEIGLLTNLTRLRLWDNQLTALPPEIWQLTNLTELELAGNLLPIPPEILENTEDPAAILNYYFTHLEGEKRPLNEAKMLIVGQGGVGKTSLVKRLMDDEYDPRENKTEGIDIKELRVVCEGTDIRLNVWDFGGQEIMHATHQFFLTKRSLYVLVLDARQGEQESRIEYWLKLIQSFGGDSPVIVVCNKSDQQEMDLDWAGLQNKYPSIKGFSRKVSCQTGEGMFELRTMIEGEVGQLEHIHDELLVSWFEIKTELEEMKEDFISYEQYRAMCADKGITEEQSLRTLVGFLHDLGIVLHFAEHSILGDTNILNPEWVTKGVYQIINSELLAQNKGILDVRDLPKILKPSRDYPKNKHPFITEMMCKFELCFDYPGQTNQRYLVPDLLPKEQPDTGEWEDSLAFEYHYDVLPGSIMSRFIVGMNPFIFQNTYWRHGVVLEYEKGRNKALVRADLEDKKVFIRVNGSEATRRTFLGVIRADLQRIHQTIPSLAVQQKVSVPGYPGVVVDYDHLLTLEELRMDEYLPERMREPVNVNRLLNGVEPEEARVEIRRSGGHVINAHTVNISGDHISAERIGTAGRNTRVRDVSVTSANNPLDLEALANELFELQEQLKANASEPEHYSAIGEVGQAERAARDGDESKALQHLTSIGKWGLGVATGIGTQLAVAMAKANIGD